MTGDLLGFGGEVKSEENRRGGTARGGDCKGVGGDVQSVSLMNWSRMASRGMLGDFRGGRVRALKSGSCDAGLDWFNLHIFLYPQPISLPSKSLFFFFFFFFKKKTTPLFHKQLTP